MSKQKNPLNGFKAEKAVQKLIDKITEISTVRQWADKARVSESTLKRWIMETYGKTAGELLKEVRYEKVLKEIDQDIEACVYSIAIDSGFESEDSLRMFLRRNYETNITAIRAQIIIGEPHIEWKWLDRYG